MALYKNYKTTLELLRCFILTEVIERKKNVYYTLQYFIHIKITI